MCELTETLFETKPSREHATYLLTLTNRKVNVEFSNYLNEGIFNFFLKRKAPLPEHSSPKSKQIQVLVFILVDADPSSSWAKIILDFQWLLH